MTQTVYVSFPATPDAYPANPHWHAQLCHFIYSALTRRFGGRVAFSPWGAPPPLRGADALVTFQPHPALARWKRSVLIDNDTFDVDKWRHAAFRRYGYDAPLDAVGEAYALLPGQFHRIVLSNDVSLQRVAARDPRVAACWDHLFALGEGRVSLHPHPIDKAYFSRLHDPDQSPDRARMLVYHGGPRKNSSELIALLRAVGFIENTDFSCVAYIDKRNEELLKFIRGAFSFVANTSFSESGPINMWEYMTAGHMVYGHEEWWDGAGNRRLCWSYDPERRDEMADNLDYLLRRIDVNALTAERNRLWAWWMDRSDNEWAVVQAEVCDRVEQLLASKFRGMA